MASEIQPDVITGYIYKIERKAVRDFTIHEVVIKKYAGKDKETKKSIYYFAKAVTFDKRFEEVARNFCEGDYVQVSGNLTVRAYTNRDGEVKAALEISFYDEKDFVLLAKSKYAGQADTRPRPMEAANQRHEAKQSVGASADFDDEIPF